MTIENLLNKIIASYKKKKLSFKMVPDSKLQDEVETSENHDDFLKFDNIESQSMYAQNSQNHKSKGQNYPYKSDAFKYEEISSTEALSGSYNPIVEMEDSFVSDINIVDWRAYKRKKISIPVDFTTSADKLYKENTRDIGPGGLFIETQKYNKLVKNQKVTMVFKIMEEGRPFKLTGKVVRVQPEGIAVQFHNISPFYYAAIEEALNIK
ncbi:MAG: PilZ domain-containing protein [Desulfamplus sp.]|nr:PilZ domain-containing protein [Desulfamplus sp.]